MQVAKRGGLERERNGKKKEVEGETEKNAKNLDRGMKKNNPKRRRA